MGRIESISHLGIDVVCSSFMKPHEYKACNVVTRKEVVIKQHFVLMNGNTVFMCAEDFELLKKQIGYEKTGH